MRELSGRFQVAQENLSTLFPAKQIGASGCSFPKASFQDVKLAEGRLSFFLTMKTRRPLAILLIVPRFQESLKEVALHYTAENFVKSREEVKRQILEALKGRLAGLLEIDDLAITNIDLSEQLEKAIETDKAEPMCCCRSNDREASVAHATVAPNDNLC